MEDNKEPFYWHSNSAESIWKRIVERCDDVEELQTEIANSSDDLPVLANPNLVYVILDAAIEKGFTELPEWLWDKTNDFEKQGLSDFVFAWALQHENFNFAKKIITDSNCTFILGDMNQTDKIMDNHQIQSYNLCTMLISKNSSFESFEWVLDQLSDELKTNIIQVNEDGSPKLLDLALLLGAENIYAGLCEKYHTEDEVTKAVKFFADTLFFNCRVNINNVIAVLDFVKGGYEPSGIELADFQKLSESMTNALDKKFAWQFSLLTIPQLENIITTLKGVLNTPNLQGVEEFKVEFFSYPSVQSAMQRIWENTPADKRKDKFKGIIWEPTVDLSAQSSTPARVSEHSFLSQDSHKESENFEALSKEEINGFTQ